MVKINGSSFPHQYRRTNPYPIDSTETWETIEDAISYARNTDAEPYMPYPGQIITVLEDGNVYKLVKDTTIPATDGKKHFKLEIIGSVTDNDDRYLRRDIAEIVEELMTFKKGIDVKGGIKTDILTALEGVTGKNITASEKTTTLNLLVKALADIYDLNVSHVATLMSTIVKDYISSESFVSGLSGSGMRIYKAVTGDWNMEIDNLTVR